MADEMTDRIRAGVAAWGRGDLAGSLESLAEDIEFVSSGLFPGVDTVYNGHAGYRQFWADFREAWDGITFEIEHLVAGAPGRYAAVGHFEATGRDGVAVGRTLGMVFTARGEEIIRIQSCPAWEETFDRAGVAEAERPTGSPSGPPATR